MSAQIIEISSSRLSAASKRTSIVNTMKNTVNGNLAINIGGEFEMSWADGKNYDMKCQICEDLEANLQDFIDGELDEISRQRLSIHLNSCAEFQQRLEEYQFLKVSAASLDLNREIDPNVSSRLRTSLQKELGLKNKL